MHKPEEVEKLVMYKMQKKFDKNDLKGMNLSFVKIELLNNISMFQIKLKDPEIIKDVKSYHEI